jgi:hypothetical protein
MLEIRVKVMVGVGLYLKPNNSTKRFLKIFLKVWLFIKFCHPSIFAIPGRPRHYHFEQKALFYHMDIDHILYIN